MCYFIRIIQSPVRSPVKPQSLISGTFILFIYKNTMQNPMFTLAIGAPLKSNHAKVNGIRFTEFYCFTLSWQIASVQRLDASANDAE